MQIQGVAFKRCFIVSYFVESFAIDSLLFSCTAVSFHPLYFGFILCRLVLKSLYELVIGVKSTILKHSEWSSDFNSNLVKRGRTMLAMVKRNFFVCCKWQEKKMYLQKMCSFKCQRIFRCQPTEILESINVNSAEYVFFSFVQRQCNP